MPGEKGDDIDREFLAWAASLSSASGSPFVRPPDVPFPSRWLPGFAISKDKPLLTELADCCDESNGKSVAHNWYGSPVRYVYLPYGHQYSCGFVGSQGSKYRIRQSKPTVDKCGCLAVQATGVSSATRWSGVFASPGRMSAR
jgi:hypothetical protein